MTGPTREAAVGTQVADLLRRLFPFGTVTEGDRVVGAWFPIGGVIPGQDDPEGAYQGFRAVWSGLDGVLRHVFARFPSDPFDEAAPALWAAALTRGANWTEARVGLGLREALDAGHPSEVDNLGQALTDAVAAQGLASPASEEVRRGIVAHRASVWDVVRRLVESLDREAVGFVSRHDLSWVEGRHWAGFDAGVDPARPLMRAIEEWPAFAEVTCQAWEDDVVAFRSRTGPEGHLETVRLWLVGNGHASRRLSHGLADLHAASVARSGARLPNLWPAVRNPGGTAIVSCLRVLEDLPPDWVPRDLGGWDAYLEAYPVVQAALRVLGGGRPLPDAGDLLRAGQGWRRWLRDCAVGAGVLPVGDFRWGVVDAADDLVDPLAAYARQVLVPARCLAGCLPRDEPWSTDLHDGMVGAAAALLTSGRGLRRILEWSGRWHAHAHETESLLSMLPGAVEVTPPWGAGIPDHARGDASIVVLTSPGALAAEGAAGPDEQGVQGLSHCVGGHVDRCLSGASRVASVRRRLVDGTTARSSTVEFSFREGVAHVAQHRGARNARPPGDDVELVSDYLAGLRRDGAVAWGDLAPQVRRADVAGVAGYAWWEPGGWEAVRDAWDPHVPPALRGLDAPTLWSWASGVARGPDACRWARARPAPPASRDARP